MGRLVTIAGSAGRACPAACLPFSFLPWITSRFPIGQRVRTYQSDVNRSNCITDLSSTRLGGLDDPIFYRPWNQDSREPANAFVRFAGSEAAITRDVIETYRTNAPELPVEATTLQSLREHNIESMNRTT